MRITVFSSIDLLKRLPHWPSAARSKGHQCSSKGLFCPKTNTLIDLEKVMKRRLGRLSIIEGVIDSPEATDIFKQLGFVPWHCQYVDEDAGPARFEMCGTSRMFDEIDEEDPAPFYEMKIIGNTGGKHNGYPIRVAVRRLLPALKPVVAAVGQALDA